ncbi:MAG TPA: hypothetical protein VFA53_02745 [Xanthobacteraceae bacterium]|nr:hypothetical protein [Xanthobacteraceae bacterium]
MAAVDFETYYEECLKLAQDARSPEQRILLLQMAQTWRMLAEQSDTIRDLFQHVTPKGNA